MIRLGFVVFAFALAPLAVKAREDIAKKEEKKEEFTLTKEEQEVIDLTNAQRAKAGLPPLAMNPQLMAAARGHAANMAAQEQLSHVLNGKTFLHRSADAGYAGAASSENIAWNQSTPNEALGSWLNSRGHRANIFSGSTEIGVAMAIGPRGDRYWVQVFGVR
jgi:uncharacterized protein YkwD